MSAAFIEEQSSRADEIQRAVDNTRALCVEKLAALEASRRTMILTVESSVSACAAAREMEHAPGTTTAQKYNCFENSRVLCDASTAAIDGAMTVVGEFKEICTRMLGALDEYTAWIAEARETRIAYACTRTACTHDICVAAVRVGRPFDAAAKSAEGTTQEMHNNVTTCDEFTRLCREMKIAETSARTAAVVGMAKYCSDRR